MGSHIEWTDKAVLSLKFTVNAGMMGMMMRTTMLHLV